MCYRNTLSNTAIKVLSVVARGLWERQPPHGQAPLARERFDAEALAAPREMPKST